METAEFIKWLVTVGIISVLTAIGSGVGIYKIIRMLRSEVRKGKAEAEDAVLKVKQSKRDYTEKLESTFDETSAEFLQLKQELFDLKKEMLQLRNDQIEMLKIQKQQADTINNQAKKITFLECQIRNYQILSESRADQVRDAGRIPLELIDLGLKECKEIK